MDYLATAVNRLAEARSCGYHSGSPAAAEPMALAALALLGHGRQRAAQRLLDDLVARQTADGSVGVEVSQEQPGWSTPLAIMAWREAQTTAIKDNAYARAAARGLAWLFETEGAIPETAEWDGHETPIRGWPWVAGTHAWVEPTAFGLLALKHSQHATHVRARQAVLLLVNRLLPTGGCNYGNTVVFGQELRPHVQPTGVCLLALAGEDDPTGRIARSCDYLHRELSARTTTASLCYGLLGLAGQGQFPGDAHQWLQVAAQRTLERDPAPYKLALLGLAARGADCPLVERVRSFEPQSATR